jgi:predicted transposase YdaD
MKTGRRKDDPNPYDTAFKEFADQDPVVPLMDGEWEEVKTAARALTQIDDEPLRQRLSFHFVMLGGLRYNHIDMLNLFGGGTMIPMEIYKESSFYKAIQQEARDEGLEEGREEGREEGERLMLIELFTDFAAKRFPGFEPEVDLDRVKNLSALKQICLDLDEVPDVATLQRQLSKLVDE